MRTFRFLPLVALSAFSLLLLKLASMLLGGGYVPTGTQESLAQAAKEEQVQAALTEPAADAKKTAADKKAGAKKKDQPPVDIKSLTKETHRTAAEIRILESLSKRRIQLETRERELDLRQKLLEAARKKIEERIGALKSLEGKIQKFAKAQKSEKSVQLNRLVKMYSSMKPAGAARIFNELDHKVLLGIIKQMKPQNMSAILAAMDPVKAREMTISMAGEIERPVTASSLDSLPKIQGN